VRQGPALVASAAALSGSAAHAFPAVRIRTRYVIPASAVNRLAAQAAESGRCVDGAEIAARRR
jgi:hypothetical protein